MISGEPTQSTEELDALPRPAALLAKAPMAARGRADAVPDVQLVVDRVRADRARLARYDRVCGFGLRDVLPATFVHVLAFPLQLALMVEHPFPLALPKLVHVANRITVRRPVRVDEPLTVTVRAERLAAHPKGATVDLVAEALVVGEPVWHGVSTYLERGAEVGGDAPAVPADASEDADVPDEPAAVWRVPRDIGRRYAAVSGDYNPIHLNPVPARLLGFGGTIAHGMWTKARSLAAVESRLPPAYTVEVRFKAPIVLPATVGFHTRARVGRRALAVRDPRNGRPHLVGEIAALADG